jgi:predicted nucleotidyltransferase
MDVMDSQTQIDLSLDRLTAFCTHWQIVEFALFGSVLRKNFRPDSDVDVLISFAPGASHTLFDLVAIQAELETWFGRRVDLCEREAIEHSRNYIRRKAILDSARIIYAA